MKIATPDCHHDLEHPRETSTYLPYRAFRCVRLDDGTYKRRPSVHSNLLIPSSITIPCKTRASAYPHGIVEAQTKLRTVQPSKNSIYARRNLILRQIQTKNVNFCAGDNARSRVQTHPVVSCESRKTRITGESTVLLYLGRLGYHLSVDTTLLRKTFIVKSNSTVKMTPKIDPDRTGSCCCKRLQSPHITWPHSVSLTSQRSPSTIPLSILQNCPFVTLHFDVYDTSWILLLL